MRVQLQGTSTFVTTCQPLPLLQAVLASHTESNASCGRHSLSPLSTFLYIPIPCYLRAQGDWHSTGYNIHAPVTQSTQHHWNQNIDSNYGHLIPWVYTLISILALSLLTKRMWWYNDALLKCKECSLEPHLTPFSLLLTHVYNRTLKCHNLVAMQWFTYSVWWWWWWWVFTCHCHNVT